MIAAAGLDTSIGRAGFELPRRQNLHGSAFLKPEQLRFGEGRATRATVHLRFRWLTENLGVLTVKKPPRPVPMKAANRVLRFNNSDYYFRLDDRLRHRPDRRQKKEVGYRFFPVAFVFNHHFTGSGSATTASGERPRRAETATTSGSTTARVRRIGSAARRGAGVSSDRVRTSCSAVSRASSAPRNAFSAALRACRSSAS
jgi:hypothetical protein